MTKKLNRLCSSLVSLAALAVTLSGCAAFAPLPPEKSVELRAKQYWQARIDGKFDKAYEFNTPAFRAARTPEQYRTRFGSSAMVKEVGVYSVTCEPLKCTARMQLTAQLNLPLLNIGNMNTYLDEVWLLEDGTWWRYEEL
jgi:hypothetical protein